jgi:hypothetical protein
MTSSTGRSLTFAKFKKSLEGEIRAFWHVLASLEYSARWWGGISTPPTRLSAYPGDDRNPFRSIDIPVDMYLADFERVRSHIRENAVVSFVTAFEYFLLEMLERLIYLDPSLIDDSSMPIEAKTLATIIPSTDVRRWLAARVADKYLRNKTHAQMIEKLDKFSKAGVSGRLKDEIVEWSNWSLVRNAIVHTSRFVTSELALAWPERFGGAGSRLKLTDRDIARVHHLAMTLSMAIDERAVKSVIGTNDARVLAREIFVHKGISNARELRRLVTSALRSRISIQAIEKVLSDQRKGTFLDSWALTGGDLDSIIA